MNLNKIDKSLWQVVSMKNDEKDILCFVRANDYKRLKNIFLHNKIEILDEYPFIKSFRVRACKKQIGFLSSLSQVGFVSSIACASVLTSISRKILGVDGTSLTGKNKTIAFIDTGICSHPDFLIGKNRIVLFKDFVAEKNHCYDDNGHGTFVSGICSGNGAMSAGKFCGIAPKSKIISLKALNENGEASADKILNAMEWIYDNHKRYQINVVCMSFGSEPLGYHDPIMSGADTLWREGIVVVAAAGNSGPEYQTIKSPGVSSNIITVGGFDDNRLNDKDFEPNYFEMAKFSSRGPAFQRYKPDLVAPSVDIISCDTQKTYTKLSGTSVATPMIAGLSLLLLEKDESMTPAQVKRKLLSCCKPICFNKNFEGYGYPNIAKLM